MPVSSSTLASYRSGSVESKAFLNANRHLGFVERPTRYPSPGHCIYCGSRENLTDEHVVPSGLWGEMILEKSSCKTCAKQTGAIIEGSILRGILLPVRLRYNSPSRTNHLEVRTFKVTLFSDQCEQEVSLKHKELPLDSWCLPVYNIPYILSESREISRPKRYVIYSISQLDAEIYLNKYKNAHAVKLDYNANITYFPRFIAKIAHSYSCMMLGCDSFKPFLQNRIIKDCTDIHDYVGTFPDIAPRENNILSLKLEIYTTFSKKRILVCKIRLMPYLQTPEYVVAVGRYLSDDLEIVRNCNSFKPGFADFYDSEGNFIGKPGAMPVFHGVLDGLSLGTALRVSAIIHRNNSPMIPACVRTNK